MSIIKKILKEFFGIIENLIYAIQDTIWRLQGYLRLDEIKIPPYYTRPRKEKIERKKEFYRTYKVLPEIIVNENNVLVDGFCTYFLAAVWNWEYVKVMKVKTVRRKVSGRKN